MIEKKKITSADEIAIELTEKILADIPLDANDEVAVTINGLGATLEMELFIVNAKVQEILKEKGVNVYKTFVGEYMTSLEMAGCSIILLKPDDEPKTMLDVWCPVADQLKKENQFNADVILRTAKEAMENTKDIMATKGRASYMKERSIGHLDPGSVSSFYLFEALAEVIQEGA